MCLFITMTLPTTADRAAAGRMLEAYGRQLVAVGQAPAIAAGEAYFLASTVSCDCDTWLGERRRDANNATRWARRHENRRRTMEKKGWSNAKIARAMTDLESAHQAKIESRDARIANGRDADIAQWSSLVRGVPKAAGASYVGLLLHQYSGAIEDEQIIARREVCSPDALEDFLLNIEEDVLYEIRLSTPRQATEQTG